METEAFEADSRLVDDLGLDSFDLVELLTLVEELGVRFPDDVAVGLDTVGDVYREYAGRAARFTGG
jgi:acyl carrier protein